MAPGVILRKLRIDDANIGAAPAVNSLVVIAYNTEVCIDIVFSSIIGCQQSCQQILRAVDILVFIHKNMLKPGLIVATNIFALLQHPDGF